MRKFITIVEALNPKHLGPVKIKLTVHAADMWDSDDAEGSTFEFDASPWFENASDEVLLDLMREGLDGVFHIADELCIYDEGCADAMANHFESKDGTNHGYVTIDEEDVQNWMMLHRPHILEAANLNEALKPKFAGPVEIKADVCDSHGSNTVTFNCIEWFEQASDRDIYGVLAQIKQGWAGKEVARWCATTNIDVANFIDEAEEEVEDEEEQEAAPWDCYIEEDDAYAWARSFRPHIMKKLSGRDGE